MLTPKQIALHGGELGQQTALFCWIKLRANAFPEHANTLHTIFAIKNEEKSGCKIIGSQNKASGVLAGVADIFIPYSAHGKHGLFLELKTEHGTQSTAQKTFSKSVKALDFAYALCFGWKQAALAIELWIGLEHDLELDQKE